MIFKPNKELKEFIKFMLTHIDTELKSINQKLDKTTALDTVIKNEYIKHRIKKLIFFLI